MNITVDLRIVAYVVTYRIPVITFFKRLTTVRSVLDFETMKTDKTAILLSGLTGGGQTYFLQRYLVKKAPMF